jgi:uncharacterized membrane protein
VILNKAQLDDLLESYSVEKANEYGMSINDQLAVIQIRLLNKINGILTIFLWITIIAIFLGIVVTCSTLIK